MQNLYRTRQCRVSANFDTGQVNFGKKSDSFRALGRHIGAKATCHIQAFQPGSIHFFLRQKCLHSCPDRSLGKLNLTNILCSQTDVSSKTYILFQITGILQQSAFQQSCHTVDHAAAAEALCCRGLPVANHMYLPAAVFPVHMVNGTCHTSHTAGKPSALKSRSRRCRAANQAFLMKQDNLSVRPHIHHQPGSAAARG